MEHSANLRWKQAKVLRRGRRSAEWWAAYFQEVEANSKVWDRISFYEQWAVSCVNSYEYSESFIWFQLALIGHVLDQWGSLWLLEIKFIIWRWATTTRRSSRRCSWASTHPRPRARSLLQKTSGLYRSLSPSPSSKSLQSIARSTGSTRLK